MPSAIKRVCRKPGCGKFCDGPFCQEHKPEARQAERPKGKTDARGYGWDWQRLRAWWIKRQPICQDCLAIGVVNDKQLEVHHIVPVKADHSKRLDPSNLMTLCRSCHAKRTADEHGQVPAKGGGAG